MGGTTRKQIAYLSENRYIEILQKHRGVIIGLSAGAINLAKKSLIISYEKNWEAVLYNGIGLIDKTIFPHFEIDNKENIKELKKLSANLEIYGMCDNAAIIEKNNETIMLGEIYKIHFGKIEKIN